MKFAEEKLIEQGIGKWIINIDGQEWSQALKKAKNRIIANLEIPGFRKGKVPLAKAQTYLTPSKIYNEAYRIMVGPAFDFALAQKPTIEPMNSPNPIPKKVSEQALVIEFVFDLKPEITLATYTEIKKINKPEPQVTSEELDTAINQYCEQFVMETTRNADEVVQNGDAVIFDFEGFMNGEAFKGGEAKDHKLVIGSNQFIPGFESAMVGLNLGEAEIEVTFPEDYNEELAGKNATFKLNIKEIKARQVPKKDDELVKDLNLPDIKTFVAFEHKVREDLLAQKQQSLKNEFVNQLVEHIASCSKIELPKSAIENQIQELKKEFEAQLAKQNMDIVKYKELTGLTETQINDELKVDAKAKLEAYLVTSEIKKQENFVVSEELLTAKYATFAKQFNMDIEQIRSMINPEMIKSEIVNEMLVDFLYANNG